MTVSGEHFNKDSLVYNTALDMGADIIKLMVRLQAQGELHLYIEEQDRIFVTDIIDQGLKTGLFRQGQGWGSVKEHIKNIDEHPGAVVTSFSICDPFPNPHLTNMSEEKWYDLSPYQQWTEALKELRLLYGTGTGIRLQPEDFKPGAYYFGDGQTLTDVFRKLKEKNKS